MATTEIVVPPEKRQILSNLLTLDHVCVKIFQK